MTKKQEKILKAALKLFAEEGFQGTPTSRIAKEAGVSEGLIFRHFKNKEGLLQAILEQGTKKISGYFADLSASNDGKSILRKIISVPFEIEKEEYAFWRLIYTLKWQQRYYDDSAMAEVWILAEKAFSELGYTDPEAEILVLEMLMDGIATTLLLKEITMDPNNLKNKVLQKYNLR